MFKVHKTDTAFLMQLNFIRPMIVRKGENLFCLDNTKTTISWYKMREEITLVQTIQFSFAITAFTYSETLKSLFFQQGSNIKEYLLTEGENINLNKCEHLQKRVRKISLENAKIKWIDTTTTSLFICYFKIEQTKFSWKSNYYIHVLPLSQPLTSLSLIPKGLKTQMKIKHIDYFPIVNTFVIKLNSAFLVFLSGNDGTKKYEYQIWEGAIVNCVRYNEKLKQFLILSNHKDKDTVHILLPNSPIIATIVTFQFRVSSLSTSGDLIYFTSGKSVKKMNKDTLSSGVDDKIVIKEIEAVGEKKEKILQQLEKDKELIFGKVSGMMKFKENTLQYNILFNTSE